MRQWWRCAGRAEIRPSPADYQKAIAARDDAIRLLVAENAALRRCIAMLLDSFGQGGPDDRRN